MPHAIPIKIPEREFSQLHAAAQWLYAADRALFLAAVADALAGQAIGPGSTCRAIALAFRAFYRPIEIGDEPQHFAKFDRGKQRFPKRSDAR